MPKQISLAEYQESGKGLSGQLYCVLRKAQVPEHVSHISFTCHVSSFTGHMSHVTIHLSLTPTATPTYPPTATSPSWGPTWKLFVKKFDLVNF